jgi:hypothetical protein
MHLLTAGRIDIPELLSTDDFRFWLQIRLRGDSIAGRVSDGVSAKPSAFAICSRLLRPRCGPVRASRYSSIMNQMTYTDRWDRRSRSAPTVLLDTGRTGEESAGDGLADYPEDTRKG